MIHGDDKGAVFPPRVAEFQVVLIPVGLNARTSEADTQKITDNIQNVAKTLTEHGVRVQEDMRSHYSPGWKFSEYEVIASLLDGHVWELMTS